MGYRFSEGQLSVKEDVSLVKRKPLNRLPTTDNYLNYGAKLDRSLIPQRPSS